MIHRRLLPAAVFAAVLCSSGVSSAKETRAVAYRYEAIWSAAVRLIRVDLDYRITDKDKDNGFILFIYPARDGVKASSASLELVALTPATQARPKVRLALRIANQPSYVAVHFLDKLESKLVAELGPPKPEDDEEPPTDDQQQDPETDQDDGEETAS